MVVSRSLVSITWDTMSKLANLLFTFELERRLVSAGADVSAIACHPGLSDTDLSRHFPGWLAPAIPLVRLVAQTSAMGALPTLRAATDPAVRGGEYYGPSQLFELMGPPARVKANAASRNEKTARKLWDLSIELTGVDPGLSSARG